MPENQMCPPDQEFNPEANKCCPKLKYFEPEKVFPAFWKASIEKDFSCFDFDEAFSQLSGEFEIKLTEHGAFGSEAFLERMEEVHSGRDLRLKDFMCDSDYFRLKGKELDDIARNALAKSNLFWEDMKEYEWNRLNGMEESELKEKAELHDLDTEDIDIDELADAIIEGMKTDPQKISSDTLWLWTDPFPDLVPEIKEGIAETVSKQAWHVFGAFTEFQDLLETYKDIQSPPDDISEKVILMDEIINSTHVTGSLWDFDVEDMRKKFVKKYEREKEF